MPITAARTSVLPAGIAEWRIKNLTDNDDAYYALPFLREGKVVIKSLSTLDGYGRSIPYAFELEASCITPAIRTEANLIDCLDVLMDSKIGHKITLINGQIISSEATSVAETGFGTKWKLISDKDMDGDMNLQITATRRLTATEYGQMLVTANAPANGTPGAGDTLYTLASLTRADVVPAGIAKIETGAAGGAIADTFDILRSGKFTAELLTTKDSRGRDTGFAIQIDLEAEAMNSVQGDLLMYDDIAMRSNKVWVTFANGMVCTMDAKIGIDFEYKVEKDMDDIAVVKIIGTGKIPIGVWAGIWS